MNSAFGAASAEINRTIPATGTYLIVVADGNSGLGGAGTYRLTAEGLYDGIKMCPPLQAGTNRVFQGAGGQPSSTFVVVTATNVTTPLASWTPFTTNQFLTFGESNFTNSIKFDKPQQFFRVRVP